MWANCRSCGRPLQLRSIRRNTVTAPFAIKEQQEDFLANGLDAILTKPITLQSLKDTLASVGK